MERSPIESNGTISFGTNGDLALKQVVYEAGKAEDSPAEVTIFFHDRATEQEYGVSIVRQDVSIADLESPSDGPGLSVVEITPLTVAQFMTLSTDQIVSYAERIVPDTSA